MTPPLVQLADVRLTLGRGSARTEILRGINFEIGEGETVAVLGASGSGKSSLMAVIAGLERATSGSVEVLGHDMSSLGEDALARLRGRAVGVVLQAFHLLPTMTALQNVMVPLELSGARDARERARAELAAVGLGAREGHYPAQLSGGEQQRVAIARATAPAPKLLLADEPTGNLDAATGARIIDLLFDRVAAAGASLLVITHDPVVAQRAGRVVRIADGAAHRMIAGLRLGRRDLAQGIGGLWLLFACLVIAIGGLAAVTSLASAIGSTIDGQARELLGGDVSLSVSQREASAAELAAMRRLGAVRGSVTLRSTALLPGDRTALIDLSGIDAGWPAAGRITLAAGKIPVGAGDAAVGRELAERYALAVGSLVRIGYADFRVSGIIADLPAPSGFALSPAVLVSRAGLAATRLVQPGSLYTSSYRIALPPEADGAALGKVFQQRFPDGGWRVTDKGDAASGTRRFTDRTGQMLLLIALGALGIGSIGIASAASAFAASRRATIAILKVHGARQRDLLIMLGTSVALLAGLAILIGLVLGAAAPAIVGKAASGLLPVAPDPNPQWGALGRSALFGLLVTLAATWLPLARAAGARPAAVLRGDVEEGGWRWRGLIVPSLAAVGAVALALVTSDNRLTTAVAIAGALALAILFAGAGWLIARTARAASHVGGPLTRLGLAALHRPGAATVRLSIALGLGLSLLVALSGIGNSIRSELDENIPAKAPALFMLDIPAAEEARFRQLAASRLPGADLRLVPSLRGPVTALNGQPVSAMRGIPEGAWILRGDRGLTFARDLPVGNRVVAGQWWPRDYAGPPLVSIDVEAAKALDLKVGDRLTVAVLGVPIEARIASFRTIDWRSFGLNFAIIFAPGTLEQAPYTLMATVAPPRGASTLAFERELARELPMVSTIRVSEVVTRVTAILEGLDGAIRIATLVAILIGVTVLAGAVAATRRARTRESILLKLVGASRGDVLAAQGIEFAAMSGGIVLLAFAAGTTAAWLTVTRLFDFAFQPGWPGLVALPVAGMLIAILVALVAAWPALQARPAAALRDL